MTQEHFKKIFLSSDVFNDILGQEQVKKELKSALLMGRHLLIVGPPGAGKTTIAKNVARLLPQIELNNCAYHCDPQKPVCPECKQGKSSKKTVSGVERFVRIQGSPDLTAEDLIGDIDPIKAMEYGPLSIEAFTPGKIFKANQGVLFFDELNRCPEKLQNALLQALQEGYVTIGSYDVDLQTNFIFIGTMNPDDSNTEKISDVLLDRFDIVYMNYPETLSVETNIVKKSGKKLVDFPEKLLMLATLFIRLLRENKNVEKAPGVRASIGLYERAQSNAFLAQRKEVVGDDVKEAMISVLAHRIKLKPSVGYLKSEIEFVKEQLDQFLAENVKDGDFT
ncbi:MAG TPA: ATP-binding protein [Candidatus Nanoarchaeia archaeon]|nr:ATP-binding protein [Candidatus Nanoarchaeia archaeon]